MILSGRKGGRPKKFVVRYFYWFVTIFSKKYDYFSPKIGVEKKLQKSVSGYLKTIKRKKDKDIDFDDEI